jgi:hypothetical protein
MESAVQSPQKTSKTKIILAVAGSALLAYQAGIYILYTIFQDGAYAPNPSFRFNMYDKLGALTNPEYIIIVDFALLIVGFILYRVGSRVLGLIFGVLALISIVYNIYFLYLFMDSLRNLTF